MKKISLYIFLIFFSFITKSFSSNLNDFQIEGISVEDSVHDYFTTETLKERSIDTSQNYYYNQGGKKYGKAKAAETLIGVSVSDDKFETYDMVQVSYLADTTKIKSITGIKYFENKYEICKTKKNGAVSEISEILDIKFKLDKYEKPYPAIGKVSVAKFIFDSGGSIVVECVDYKKEITVRHGWIDALLVTINSQGEGTRILNLAKPDVKPPSRKGNTFVTIRPQQGEIGARPKF